MSLHKAYVVNQGSYLIVLHEPKPLYGLKHNGIITIREEYIATVFDMGTIAGAEKRATNHSISLWS